MNLEVEKDETNFDSGTFLLNNLPTKILFNSGANYSFVSHKFSRKLALSVDKIDSALAVEDTSGKFIRISDYIKNIVINLNGN